MGDKMKKSMRFISLALSLCISASIFSGCSDAKVLLNGEKYSGKDEVIVSIGEDTYINIEDFLKSRDIEVLELDNTYTYVMNPELVLTLDTKAMVIIEGGHQIELNDMDLVIKDDKVLLNIDVYERFFDENIVIDEAGKTINIISEYEYITPEELTLYDYFTGDFNSSEIGRVYRADYKDEVLKAEGIKVLDTEEAEENLEISRIQGVNLEILDMYNAVTVVYDMYNMYQLQSWDSAAEASTTMGAYGLVMNLSSVFQSIIDLEEINELNNIKEFTEEDLEYINRINTVISALPVSDIAMLGDTISIFSSKIDGDSEMAELYRETAAEVQDEYNTAVSVYKNIKVPAFATCKDTIEKMRAADKIQSGEAMGEDGEEIVKDLLEWIENNPYEVANSAKNHWIEKFLDYAPAQWAEKLEPFHGDLVELAPSIIELVDTNGKIDIEDLTENIEQFNSSYNNFIEAVGIINNILVVLDKPDYEKFDFASSIDTGRVKAAMSIFDTLLNPGGMVSSGNPALMFSGTYLSIAFGALQEIGDHIERLANTVGGLILMALSDEVYDIDAVFNGESTMDKYIYQE